jgi:trimeric autotransporter adhesin
VQTGPLQLVTTDANGNLASDGGALQAQVNTNTTGLAAVGNRVTTIEGTLNTLQGQSTTNTTNITNLGNRVTTVETQTNTNTTSITNLGGRVTTVEGQTATNTRDIATVQTQTNTNTAAITTTNQRVTSLDTRMGSAENRITALEQAPGGSAAMDNRVSKVEQKAKLALEGVAVSLAVADPILRGNEVFGMRMNFGTFGGETALGASLVGVIDQNVFGNGERLAITGGLGIGLSEGNAGGRIGAQLTW